MTAAEPDEGDLRLFVFTADNGGSIFVSAEYVECASGSVEPCVPLELAAMILDTWREADPGRRKYGWPPDDHGDDDCAIAYTAWDGGIVLDWWRPADDAELYSLEALPRLLPADHYTLQAR